MLSHSLCLDLVSGVLFLKMDETEHHADADINQSLKYIQFFKKTKSFRRNKTKE